MEVPNFEGAFKPLTQLEDRDMGFEVLVRVLESVKASKGLPGLKNALVQMRGPLMELKGLDTKDALHDLLMQRKLFRDVTEVISKVAWVAKKSFKIQSLSSNSRELELSNVLTF